MSVAIDGGLASVIFTPPAGSPLIVKSGANSVPWTLTFPTTPGAAGQVLTTNGSGVLSWSAGGGGGTPAAPVNSIQFNNAGAFGGDPGIAVVGPSAIKLGVANSQTGALVFADAFSAFAVSIRSGQNTVPWDLKLPTGPGTNGQVLTTDGNGVTSWATAAGATIVDDTTTAADEYPLFANVTSGSPTNYYVSSTKYTYNPSTGILAAPHPKATDGIFLNTQTITADYTLPAGLNGLSGGPMNVPVGINVTVPAGANWAIA